MIKKIVYAAVPIFLLVLMTCSSNGKVHRKRLFFRMDTVSEITLSVPESFDVDTVWKKVDSFLAQSEKRFSVSRAGSEVRLLNERSKKSMPVSDDLGEMLRLGLAYGDTLDGAFDITVLPLKELWGFDEQANGDAPLPEPAQVKDALSKVDYRKVELNDAADEVTIESPEIRIDVGGIAKGYVLRQLEELVRSYGINDYLIVAGGDIVSSGARADNSSWVIGVQHPRNRSEMLATLPLDKGALVTSGDYERFRVVDGRRYHHLFDTRTGYSCGENRSLTIWATDPVIADIYSTGLFCRSAREILQFVQDRPDLECIVVDSNGKAHISSGWKNKVNLGSGSS
ncbi:MAG: FAD:protein FMN transferase [Chitinispirillaceae bacterium]